MFESSVAKDGEGGEPENELGTIELLVSFSELLGLQYNTTFSGENSRNKCRG